MTGRRSQRSEVAVTEERCAFCASLQRHRWDSLHIDRGHVALFLAADQTLHHAASLFQVQTARRLSHLWTPEAVVVLSSEAGVR